MISGVGKTPYIDRSPFRGSLGTLWFALFMWPRVEAQRERRPKWRTVHIDSCNAPQMLPCSIWGLSNMAKHEMFSPGFEQCIKCNTTKTQILEKSYRNTARAKPPLETDRERMVTLWPLFSEWRDYSLHLRATLRRVSISSTNPTSTQPLTSHGADSRAPPTGTNQC